MHCPGRSLPIPELGRDVKSTLGYEYVNASVNHFRFDSDPDSDPDAEGASQNTSGFLHVLVLTINLFAVDLAGQGKQERAMAILAS